MPEITHLTSQQSSHLQDHFERRGLGTLDQLAKLRAEPEIGERRKARYIDASLHFFPGEEHNGIPHRESVDWLRQYARADSGVYRDCRGYLVVTAVPHQEDCPLQIWESAPSERCPELDVLDSEYRLVWKRQEEED